MVTSAQVARIIELVTLGDISIEDAARQLGWVERGEAKTCSTCEHFKINACCRPDQPIRFEHPDSVRCVEYVKYDHRDHALPATPRPGSSRMWK